MLVGSNSRGAMIAPAERGSAQDSPGVLVSIGPAVAAFVWLLDNTDILCQSK